MKKYNQGFVIPLLIAIIALLGISGGAYVYVNNKSADKLENSLKEISKNTGATTTNVVENNKDDSKIVPTNTVTSIVSDWKTYKNEKYGFEFLIPKNWDVVVSEGRGCCGRTSIARFFIGEKPFLNGVDRGLSIYIHDRKNDKQYEDIQQGANLALAVLHSKDEVQKITTNREECISKHIKDIKIGEFNLPTVEVYDASNDCYSPIYQFVTKGNLYDYVITPLPINSVGYVGYDGKLEVSKSLPEFNQILSTFKVTK
jgi:hypothetical protein